MFLHHLYCYLYRRSIILDEKDAEAIAELRALARSQETAPACHQHRSLAFVPPSLTRTSS